MLGIREKLSLGFGGLFLIIIAISVQSIMQLTLLGHSIDVILHENYRSVIASQQMKDSLERMDSGILFTLLGDTEQGKELITKSIPVFEESLHTALNNITLPGEAERATRIGDLFSQYKASLQEVQDTGLPLDDRREAYFTKLFPLFHQIKNTADEILHMNQQNMLDANERALAAAAAARHRMYILLFCGAVVAVLFTLFTGRWILRPINRLIRSADEIRQGNLDLVVQRDSGDEIGRLSEAFNEMTSSLREFRRSNRTRMIRIQHLIQQVFRSLPDVVAVINLEGHVEIATERAADVFGLRPDVPIHSLTFTWMGDLFDEALRSRRTVQSQGKQTIIQRFIRGEEHYFCPEAIPILDAGRLPTGVILILKDVTSRMQQDKLKRGVISTVSHQLKTPLTSLRLAIYLLLEEKAGPLTSKQVELLVAARDESDRLHSILSNLLDLSRIESGKVRMEFRPVAPHGMILEQVDSFRNTAKNRGITLKTELSDDLPEVLADQAQIGHVFANLLSNAIKYTSPGGEVTISAEADEDSVCFSVSDTGRGIPAQYLDRIFEQFFRIDAQEGETGEGLGLSIAKEIVEAHGGTIRVKSEEGRGSIFTFCLKRADRTLNSTLSH
ncbi:ATP-binding protein [Desulforhabdus amnigena]|uniref:histidine kinase n=1 Tax=Desulforhabdus amnigena TaxID=40218 RepID=A0A9W6FWQ5_9BACT|nr:ATP-binding protein [Desulforhabdus amnigena]GLI36218.1 PAS domain-containing sensor histidine kinase [Desulforhabdus amnigena]